VLRRARPSSGSGQLLEFADLSLDQETYEFRRAGHVIELSPTEFRLLRFFMLAYLRRKLARRGPELVRTRRAVGYSLRMPPSGDTQSRRAQSRRARGAIMLTRRITLRLRVMAGAVVITLIALAAFDFAAVNTMRGYLLRSASADLQQALKTTAPQLNAVLPAATFRSAADLAASRALSLRYVVGEYSVVYRPLHGQRVILQYGVAQSVLALEDWRIAHAGTPVTMGVTYTAVSPGALVVGQRAPGGVLLAGTSLDQVNRTVGRIVLIVVLGSVAAVLLIGLGVFWLLRRGLRPIEAMAAQADRITAGDLADRVTPHHPRSEVGRLGAALNGMLARIQAAVRERESSQDQMRRFFADASHELRTPLASLRANAELYQQGALSGPGQVNEVMRRITLETQRMSRLVDDMLRLARLGLHPDRCRELVDLTTLLRACAERARSARPGRVWQVYVSDDLTTIGDEELLRSAIDNLLMNVLVHTPDGTVGTITAFPSGHDYGADDGVSVTIEVSDDGPGVPSDELPHIFERFYRAGATPARPGSGLGLAIAAEVAAAHGGTAQAASAAPHGLHVTLTLPAHRPPDPERATGQVPELAASTRC